MANGNLAPVVVIFDNHPDSLYRDFISEGAEQAEWEAIAFADPDFAADEINRRNELGAIIATLGWHNDVLSTPGSFSQSVVQPVIRASNRIGVPRAVVSDDKKGASLYLRSGTRDVVIPFSEEVSLSGRVTSFLGALREHGVVDLGSKNL